MFRQFRPLLQIGSELRRIADALEYFATQDARANNRMFLPKKRGWRLQDDKSELLHTNRDTIDEIREAEEALMLDRGYPALELEDLRDEL